MSTRTLGVAAALLTVAVLAWVFRFVQRYDPFAARPLGTAQDVVLSAEDAFMLSRYCGETRWTLHVARIGLRCNPGADPSEFHTAEFQNVSRGTFFENNKPKAYFAAERATYQKPVRMLEVEGRLTLRSVDGEVFEARRCVYSEQDRLARFPEGAKARIQDNELTAPHMLYDPSRSRIQCLQGATATFRGREITAAMLEWDLENQRVRCQGPVSGKHGNAKFTAESAELDLRARIIRVNKGRVELRMDSQQAML